MDTEEIQEYRLGEDSAIISNDNTMNNRYNKYTYDFFKLEEAKDTYNSLIELFLHDDVLECRNPKNDYNSIKKQLLKFKIDFNDKCTEIMSSPIDIEEYRKNIKLLILISVSTTEYLNNIFNKENYPKNNIKFTFKGTSQYVKDLVNINFYIIRRLNPSDFKYRLSLIIMSLLKLIGSIMIIFSMYYILFLINETIATSGTSTTVLGIIGAILLCIIYSILNMLKNNFFDKKCDYHYFKILNECLNIKESIQDPIFNNFKPTLKSIYDELKFWIKK